MRAKPSAPATTPSCQSASAPARPISGSSGLKAPIEKQLQRLMKQSSAVLLKARTARFTRPASPIPSRTSHQLRSCTGNRGAVKDTRCLILDEPSRR
jgi:hypothetical protein